MELRVVLIKPSLYDEDGYVLRFHRGVLPSNTLGCLNGLLHDLPAHIPGLEIETQMLDEVVDRIDPSALIAAARTFSGKTLFFLCGVQTNMVPRATDIARMLRAGGQTVLLGGFHASGVIAVFGKPDEGLQTLLDLGVTVVAGEVEDTLPELIRAALANQLESLYNFLGQKPELDHGALPLVHNDYLSRFALSSFSTLDLGRGCPYSCSFCTIINVHGNTMRPRDVALLESRLIDNYDRLGISYYFFTDDNMARHPRCEEVFALLTRLREEGRNITFMMQADVLAYRHGFAERAARAGCTQVFLGMESLNMENLKAAGKKQNRVSEFRQMIEAWRKQGIMTHVGYIIGFPHDSIASVQRDVRMLADEIGVDLASFFVLTPLPGSEDHRQLVDAGVAMDSDFNRFDSFHPVTAHPLMSADEWDAAYRFAWDYFYSVKRMAWSLRRLRGARLRDMWGSYLWYAYSRQVHGLHPMICGFGRIKRRDERRLSLARESWPEFLARRTVDRAAALMRTSLLLVRFGWLYLIHLPRLLDHDGDAGTAAEVRRTRKRRAAVRRPGGAPCAEMIAVSSTPDRDFAGVKE